MRTLIAGALASLALAAPAHAATTLDFEDVAAGQPAEALYAGSGALGLEALSRGARYVSLVEADRQACQVIRKNVEGWGIDTEHRVVECSVEKSRGSLERASSSGRSSRRREPA